MTDTKYLYYNTTLQFRVEVKPEEREQLRNKLKSIKDTWKAKQGENLVFTPQEFDNMVDNLLFSVSLSPGVPEKMGGWTTQMGGKNSVAMQNTKYRAVAAKERQAEVRAKEHATKLQTTIGEIQYD